MKKNERRGNDSSGGCRQRVDELKGALYLAPLSSSEDKLSKVSFLGLYLFLRLQGYLTSWAESTSMSFSASKVAVTPKEGQKDPTGLFLGYRASK